MDLNGESNFFSQTGARHGRDSPHAGAVILRYAGWTWVKAPPVCSRPAADHVEQATHDALAIGPQPVVGVLVGDPGPQPTNATSRLLGK